MPIEIKELIIRASVQDEAEASGPGEPSSGAKNIDTEQIVSRCVEQIMEIIRIQNER